MDRKPKIDVSALARRTEERSRARELRKHELAEAKQAFLAEFLPILEPFGERPPVLVACERGGKKPRYPWKKGVTDLLDDYRLSVIRDAFIDGGNLAVILGEESHNLCDIDFDRDDLIDTFLALNPAFRDTFRTRGSKGAAFWFFAENEHYPHSVKRFEIGGVSVGTGEFRGAQLVTFFGIGAKGSPYEILVDEPAITFDYSKIVWPGNWKFVTTRDRWRDPHGETIARKPFSGKPGDVTTGRERFPPAGEAQARDTVRR
jgi:hypothetical protein